VHSVHDGQWRARPFAATIGRCGAQGRDGGKFRSACAVRCRSAARDTSDRAAPHRGRMRYRTLQSLLSSLSLSFAVLGAFAAPLPAQDAVPADPLAAARALPAQPAPERGATIRVTDAAGAACPRALVLVAARHSGTALRDGSEDPTARWLHDPVRGELAAALAAHAVRVELDADGTARVTVPPGGASVLALDGDAFARAAIGARPVIRARATVLTVRPPARIPVEVTGADGAAAADVPVRIQAGRRVLAAATTDADGKAVLVHLRGDEPGETRIVVGAATVRTRQAPVPALDEAVAFRLPPCAAVVATVAGLPTGARPAWQLLQTTGSEPLSVPATRTGEGTAEFAFVEPGVPAVVQLSLPQLAGGLRAELPALTAGAVHRVVLDLATCLRLPLRIVHPDGTPATDRALRVRVAKPGYMNLLSVRTDATGAVEVLASDAYLGADVHVQCLAEPQPTATSFALGGRAVGDATPIDVKLAALQAIAAGRALLPDGRPAEGVTVACADAEALGSVTGADGTFRILRAPPLPARVELRLGGNSWYLRDSSERTLTVDGGDTGVVLHVVAAARLRVGVVDPPALRDARVQVQCVDPAGRRRPFATVLPLTANELRVPEGTWDLLLHFGDEARPALRIAGVAATSAIETHDARLMALDWRTFADVLSLRVEDPDGRPCDAASVHREVGPDRWNALPPLRAGRAEVLVAKGGVRVRVQPLDRALRTAELAAAAGERTVRLAPATRVTLRLEPMPVLPAGARLQAWLEHGNRPGIPVDVGADGRAVLFASHVGEMRLVLLFRVGNKGGSLPDAVTALDVGEKDIEHRIAVTPAMTARIAELARELAK
jgi:hypothetical protein